MTGFEDDALLEDGLGDLDLELEARFAELERRADLADAAARAGSRPTAPTPTGGAADPLADLKAAFTSSAEPKASTDTGPEVREFLLVLCPDPACGRKNRLDRARALAADTSPRCGACGTALVTRR